MASDLNKPSDEGGEALPNLNEQQHEDEATIFKIHDAYEDDLVGGDNIGGQKTTNQCRYHFHDLYR